MARLYGIGTGPGDPELLTLKAVRILKEVDFIFAVNNKGKNMAVNSIREFIDEEKIVYFDFPMGKVTDLDYKNAALEIKNLLEDNKTGAFVTIGDTLFYSTVINTFKYLEDIDIEYIPAIPSFVACANVAGFPLAYIGENFTVYDRFPDEIRSDSNSFAVLKGIRITEENLDMLESSGFEYVFIEKATLYSQRVLTDKEDILNSKEYISLLLARRKNG